MSDKPKIYAHCPAGCSWETVHKDDFEKSAALVEVTGTNKLNLQAGKTYRFKNQKLDSGSNPWGIVVKVGLTMVNAMNVNIEYILALPTYDKYTDYLYIRVLDVYMKKASAEAMNYFPHVIYEINGVRYDKEASSGYYTSDVSITDFCVMGTADEEIYIQNDGTIKGEKGDPGAKGEKGDKGDPGTGAPVVQTTGNSTEAVMSQKAVMDAINAAVTTALNTEV